MQFSLYLIAYPYVGTSENLQIQALEAVGQRKLKIPILRQAAGQRKLKVQILRQPLQTVGQRKLKIPISSNPRSSSVKKPEAKSSSSGFASFSIFVTYYFLHIQCLLQNFLSCNFFCIFIHNQVAHSEIETHCLNQSNQQSASFHCF